MPNIVIVTRGQTGGSTQGRQTLCIGFRFVLVSHGLLFGVCLGEIVVKAHAAANGRMTNAKYTLWVDQASARRLLAAAVGLHVYHSASTVPCCTHLRIATRVNCSNNSII